jgi:hypothetical protein
MSAEQHARAMARDRRAQAATAPRVGGVLVMSDTLPGYWGWGVDEAAAVEQWRRSGGRGASLRFVIDPYWSDVRPNDWGQVYAEVTDPAHADVPRKDRPPVIVSGERVGPRGKRTPLDLD